MAGNMKYTYGRNLPMAVASTVQSGDPVLIGKMGGVATTDYSAVDGKAAVDFGGVYDLSVKGVSVAGNSAVAVGDSLYYVTGDTPVLSKKSSGVFFGYALETVGSGSTATIMVKIVGSSGPDEAGYSNLGLFISTEQTGNGAAQTIAHGLGGTPAHVVVALTEFASGLNVDVAEGTHTSTNVIVTVTSAVKYKVMAVLP